MNISLTPELDSYIQEKVQTGMYRSASEVVLDGLRLLRERDRLRQASLDRLKSDIETGIEHIDAGQFTAYEPADIPLLAERVKSKGRVTCASRGT